MDRAVSGVGPTSVGTAANIPAATHTTQNVWRVTLRWNVLLVKVLSGVTTLIPASLIYCRLECSI